MRRKSGRWKSSPNVSSEWNQPQHWRVIFGVRDLFFSLPCVVSLIKISRSVSKEEVQYPAFLSRISMILLPFSQSVLENHTISPDGYDVGR